MNGEQKTIYKESFWEMIFELIINHKEIQK